MEPDLRDPEKRIRLLDDDNRLQRLASMLREHDVPLTCFTVMSAAPRYFDRLNALASVTRVEFAVHSFSHDTANPASEREVKQAAQTYRELWNIDPRGYRAPNCLIDAHGIDNLVREGFVYDSSIVPSVRFDGYAYNNVGYKRDPFRFIGPNGSIVELPIACLGGMRLPLVFSYVKLLGLGTYRAAMNVFPLPDVVVTYFHPYDLYVDEIARYIPGWKQYAHRRNARNAEAMLEHVIVLLKSQGYQFILMEELAASLVHAPLVKHRLDGGVA